jgi:hypothetical protein
VNRPSLGTVLAATACIVALSSTGVAADAASLISGSQIKANSITTKQIKNGTLTNADMAPGTLTTGPQGPKGDTGPSHVYYAYKDAYVTVPHGTASGSSDDSITVGLLSVPAGSYEISAKAVLSHTGSGTNFADVDCKLTAAGNYDYSHGRVGEGADWSTLSDELAITTASPTTIKLGCANWNATDDGAISYVKILATQVGAITIP